MIYIILKFIFFYEKRLAGQRIIARLRQSAYKQVLHQDMAWHDLQGKLSPSVAIPAKSAPSNSSPSSSALPASSPSSSSSTSTSTGPTGVGDIISRLNTDAVIVGDNLTRELADGLRYVIILYNLIKALLIIK